MFFDDDDYYSDRRGRSSDGYYSNSRASSSDRHYSGIRELFSDSRAPSSDRHSAGAFLEPTPRSRRRSDSSYVSTIFSTKYKHSSNDRDNSILARTSQTTTRYDTYGHRRLDDRWKRHLRKGCDFKAKMGGAGNPWRHTRKLSRTSPRTLRAYWPTHRGRSTQCSHPGAGTRTTRARGRPRGVSTMSVTGPGSTSPITTTPKAPILPRTSPWLHIDLLEAQATTIPTGINTASQEWRSEDPRIGIPRVD